jgi:competence protein ComEC
MSGLFVTSLVAGLATTPFGIYHFHRAAPLTLVANMLAMPAVALVVMPMVLLTVVLMPFGLEALPLAIMDWGLAWVVGVAAWTTDWSSNVGGVRMVPALSLLLVVVGFLWLALWRERWRLLGFLPIAVAVPIAILAPRPDILVDGDGATVAARGTDGRLSIVEERGSRFAIEYWLRADADPREADAADLGDGVLCDPLGCTGAVGAGAARVSLVLKPGAFAEDCQLAAIVVSRLRAPGFCRDTAIVIDRTDLDRRGAHAVYRVGEEGAATEQFRVATAYPDIPRPWMAVFNNGE